ncbi:WD40 repeat-like protein, partial [Didymella exigua CBS 183.55]
MHRRRWVCVEHGKQWFYSKEDFAHHLVHSHANATSSQQVNVLSEISERQVEDSEVFPCPFCQAQKRLKQLEAHVAEHLESIALFVLPSDGDNQEGECDGNSEGVGAANNSSQSISSFSFTDSDRRAATSGGQNTGRLRETSSNSIVYSVIFSPDLARLASASTDKIIKLWDASSGTLLQSLEGHFGSVFAIAFSPNGKTLAASTDSTIRVWDVGSSALLQLLQGHSNYVKSVAFSPDGALLQSLEGHSGSVSAVAFSPNGKTLASASTDCLVKVWEVASGVLLQSLDSHSGSVNAIAFLPDGKTLMSASTARTVQTWDTKSGVCLRRID